LFDCPFIIWQNRAASELETETLAARGHASSVFADGSPVSANYFGAYILKILGLEAADPFVDLLNQMMETRPVILERQYAARNGGKTELLDLEMETPPDIMLYRSWEYLKIVSQR